MVLLGYIIYTIVNKKGECDNEERFFKEPSIRANS